jgi:hypothetical protein
MEAALILTSVALLLVVSVVWEEARTRDALDVSRRTRLLVAAIFAAVGIVTALLH